MHTSHTLHAVRSDGPDLLTARDVQQLLHVDRSTVYRMADDGRLPGIRVGNSWRFPRGEITALLRRTPKPVQAAGAAAPAVGHELAPLGQAVTDVAAELLGVSMVVTDMAGQPVTQVANPCGWFRTVQADPSALAACIDSWAQLASHPDLATEFTDSPLGFQCARSFVRSGNQLTGMLLAGGVSRNPADAPTLHYLDEPARARVLSALPRIAAVISRHSSPTPTHPPASMPT